MSEKVLLIDDEPDFLKSLSERMTIRGMDVSMAETPENAISTLEKGEFDAIVLDLQMPGMDGIDVLKYIKTNHSEMQVILLSGHATLEKGIEAMKLGAMDFMEKPADIDALTEKIKKAQAKKMVLVEKNTEEKLHDIMNTRGW